MKSLFSVLLVLLALADPLSGQQIPADATEKNEDWVFLSNGHLRVGILRSHGGAIGLLSSRDSDFNVLNHFDHGRLVQQSYYGDEDGSKWVDQPWRFNPVQGGDYRGHASIVQELRSTETTAYVKTVPRHWASGALLDQCTMEQWIELDGPILHARYKFTYKGSATHAPRHQETPAVFVNPELPTLILYEGDRPWTDDALVSRTPGWPNESASLGEHWAAFVGKDNAGVGVYVPSASEATCYRYLGGSGSNCSYIAPVQTFALMPDLTFSYSAYFTLGNAATIRARFKEIHQAKE